TCYYYTFTAFFITSHINKSSSSLITCFQHHLLFYLQQIIIPSQSHFNNPKRLLFQISSAHKAHIIPYPQYHTTPYYISHNNNLQFNTFQSSNIPSNKKITIWIVRIKSQHFWPLKKDDE